MLQMAPGSGPHRGGAVRYELAHSTISQFSLGWWRLYVDAIIGRPYHSVFIITYFVYYIFKLYCYLLYNAAFEYALITIGETASFFQGLLKGLSVGSSCSHVALSCLYSYRCAASSPVASTDTCTACTGI